MPSNNNYIEEFFISIGIDTKKVQKDVNEINKILGKVGKGVGSKPITPITPPIKKVKDDISLIDKALQRTRDKEIKREMDLHKIKVKNIKREKAERDRSIKAQTMGSSLKYDKSYLSMNQSMRTGFDERIRSAVSNKDVATLRLLKKEMNATAAATKGLSRQMVGLGVVQRGLNDSTRNMIRSYASVFALFQGTVAIKKVGMEFESLRASLLTVSDSEEDAAEKMSFIRNEAVRLGVDLKAASRAYLGLAASAGDALGEGGVRTLFTSVLGISKAFGMSVDDTKGTFKAFTQMLSKGNVQAEELRGQLG